MLDDRETPTPSDAVPTAFGSAVPDDPTRPTGEAAPEPAPAAQKSFLAAAWEWARPLVVLLVVLFSFRSAVADWNDVPTGSMKPTILVGDRVFVNKVAYDLKVPFTTWRLAEWGDPHRGDIVVLKSPENGRRLIKRVIGVPGDEVELRNNRLYVGGRPADYEPIDQEIADRIDEMERSRRVIAWESLGADESHPVMVIRSYATSQGNFGPVRVPDGEFFMMGDNRDESRDSRSIGFVARELILGRAEGVAFSLDHEDGWRFRRGRWFEALE